MNSFRTAVRSLLVTASVAAFSVAVGIVPTATGQTKTERIQFAAGEASAVRKGTIRGYATRDYVLQASEGQRMSVKLESRSTSLYFNILDKETMVALDTEPPPREVTEWSGFVPKTGTYVIRVYLVRAVARRNATAAYALTVSIANPKGSSKPVIYGCDGNAEIAVSFVGGEAPGAQVDVGDTSWWLGLAPSGSGSRYTDGSITLWIKGNEATYESPTLTVTCLALDPAATTPAALESSTWKLVSMTRDGKRIEAPAGVSIDATFRNGRVTGTGVCNRYFANYSATPVSNLAISEVGATKVMCPQNADFESAYFASLSKTTRFVIAGNSLKLLTPTGSLLFAK